jgi:biotin transport system ATP-binding protein
VVDIEVNQLVHRYPDGTVGLAGVDLIVERGEFVVIAGGNGSGKTTLLRHLNGLLLPTQGHVRINGRSVAKDPVHARRRLGMVFQNADAQIVGDTVYDDVAFGPENLGLDRREIDRRVSAALTKVGLIASAGRAPHRLSGGEKRRLAIAGVLAMEPEGFLFDEPYSNLDYPGVRQVLAHMVELHRRGHTLIVATHALETVAAHADRLVFLSGGRVAKSGPLDKLLAQAEQFGVREPCTSKLGFPVFSWLDAEPPVPPV